MTDVHKCIKCGAQCCRTVGVEIDTPKSYKDFEFLKWYLFHEGIEIYKDKHNTWNLELSTKCKHLGKNHLCKIYDKRPDICREFSEGVCDDGTNVLVLFQTPEDVDKHIAKLKKQKAANKKKS